MGVEGLPDDLERYRFIRVLGYGGLATVYLVEDIQSLRRGVMKVARAEPDTSAQARFHQEAAFLSRLHHPNIPALYDSGILADGRPFLVTEWVEGRVLAGLLESRIPISLQDVLSLAGAVASALSCAHQQKVLHLDVKPANILVPGRGGGHAFEEAKLLDFSVLEKLEADTGLTRAGTVVGTPYYMSPEQVRGEALTPAADIFSLGVLMYEMLSGRRPFQGETPQEMFFGLLSKEPEPLGSYIPPRVAGLVRRCLAKDPGARPGSGAEMAALIEELLHSTLPGGTLPLAPGARLPASDTGHGSAIQVPATLDQTVGQAIAAPVRSLRSSTLTLALAAAIAVGIAVCAILLAKGKGPAAEVWLISLGALLIVAGVVMGMAVRRYVAARRDRLTGEISGLLKGARTRAALSMTLSLQVDEVISKCRLMDEKFLGLTMALMVKEYGSARKFDDRQKALMNAIAILDKLGPKLSPWYVRHEKLVATGVSLVGILSGLATAAQSAGKLLKGLP
jgi:hypothetical protein